MLSLEDLSVGDFVCITRTDQFFMKGKVTAVTKTQIKVGNSKYRKSDGYDMYSRTRATPWTQDDEDNLIKSRRIQNVRSVLRSVSNINPHKISADDVDVLKSILARTPGISVIDERALESCDMTK